jgi:hypothetical protein
VAFIRAWLSCESRFCLGAPGSPLQDQDQDDQNYKGSAHHPIGVHGIACTTLGAADCFGADAASAAAAFDLWHADLPGVFATHIRGFGRRAKAPCYFALIRLHGMIMPSAKSSHSKKRASSLHSCVRHESLGKRKRRWNVREEMMRAGLIATLLLTIVGAVPAQTATDLIPGARIRYEVDGRKVIAGVNAVRGDSATVVLWQQPGMASLSLSSVGPIDISRGHESRWAQRPALGGAAFGAFAPRERWIPVQMRG